MKLFVTGASGFVGKNLVLALSKDQKHDVCLGLRAPGKLKDFSQLNGVSSIYYYLGMTDVCLPENTDVVVHLAEVVPRENEQQ